MRLEREIPAREIPAREISARENIEPEVAQPDPEEIARSQRAREEFNSLFRDAPGKPGGEAGPSEDDLEKGLREFWNEELAAESRPLIPDHPPAPRRERTWDVEDEIVEAEDVSPRAPDPTDRSDDPGRKRRRRRRRGRGRDNESPRTGRDSTPEHEKAKADFDSRDIDEPDFEIEEVAMDEPRSGRSGRAFREPDFGDDLDPDERPQRRVNEPRKERTSETARSEDEDRDSDRESEAGKRRRRRRRRRGAGDVESTKEVESRDDDFELSDDEADDAVAAYRGNDRDGVHKRIPTWLEAVNLLIDRNMNNRSSQPPQQRGHRGGRGRGRR